MKGLLYILSISLLYLYYPCLDAGCEDHGKSESYIHTTGHIGTGEDHDCAPFCFDPCCNGYFVCGTARVKTIATDFSNCVFADYFSAPLPIHVAVSIWQPPRV